MAKQGSHKQLISPLEWRGDALLAKAFRKLLKLSFLKSCYLETPYGRLHYYDSAPGSDEVPAVLVHGMGSSGQSFAVLAALMAPQKRIVLPDLFHFSGFSVSKKDNMDIHEHVDSLAFFIENIAGGRAVELCGLSLGGWAGLWLALKRPELLKSLALLNPAGVAMRESSVRDTLLYLDWKKFESIYPFILKARPFHGVSVVSQFAKRTMFRVLKNDGVEGFVRSITHEHLLDSLLHEISTPVLLMWGMEDRFLSPQTPEMLARNIRNIEAVYVEKCAHILCLEAPLNVYYELLRFWKIEESKDNLALRLAKKLFPVYSQRVMHKHEAEVRAS